MRSVSLRKRRDRIRSINVPLNEFRQSASEFVLTAPVASSVREVRTYMNGCRIWDRTVVLLSRFDDFPMKRFFLNRRNAVVAACRSQHLR
jgi:hypothetical protein